MAGNAAETGTIAPIAARDARSAVLLRAVQPSSMNVIAHIDSAVPLAQQSRPKPHWHKVG
jgi:hypothetical protein